MNPMKTVFASAVLALAFAIPSAYAQNPPQGGVVECAVKLASCIAGGNGVAKCGIEFVQCMASGGAAPTERREN